MSWHIFRVDGTRDWKFRIEVPDDDEELTVVEMTLPEGGFRDEDEDLTLLSIGIGRWERCKITLDPDDGSLVIDGILSPRLGSRYQPRFKHGDNAFMAIPRMVVPLPHGSFDSLQNYINSIPKLYDSHYDFYENNINNRPDPNQLREFEFAPAAAPVPVLPGFVPEPLAENEQTFEYNQVPNVQDIINAEYILLTAVDNPDNVIFKYGPSFFLYSKEDLRALNEHSRVAYECTQQLVGGGAPRRNQIYVDRPYFLLPGVLMSHLIPYGQLLTLLDHPAFHTFELVQAGEIPNTASYLAVIDDPASGRGLDGQMVNLVGLDHCTAGTNKPVFAVHPLRITAAPAPAAAAAQEGAGRRKTRRRRSRRMRKNKSRHAKRRRSQ